MRWTRRFAMAFVSIVGFGALFAGFLAPAPYDKQFREYPNAIPSTQFPLGTDELGRDRLSRMLYGSRVSLLLAPAAAGLTIAIALVVGLGAGLAGKYGESIARGTTDMVVAIPSLLLLFIARAMLPLNIDSRVSVAFTFALLGILGWTSAVRIILATVEQALNSEHVRQAKAWGSSPLTIAFRHIGAAVRPVAIAQFWVMFPLFLIAEANLGMLGLGVAEPLPSWGSLLAEMQAAPSLLRTPWLLSPVVLLVALLLSLQTVLSKGEGR